MTKQLKYSICLAIAVVTLAWSENASAMSRQPPPDFNAMAPIDNGCRVTVYHTYLTADAPITTKTSLTRAECNAINNTANGIAYSRWEPGNVSSQYSAYAQLTGRVDWLQFPHDPISGLSAQELIDIAGRLPDQYSFNALGGYTAHGTWFIDYKAEGAAIASAPSAPAPSPAPVAPAPTPVQDVYVAPTPSAPSAPTQPAYEEPVYDDYNYRFSWWF